jgi:murein DD-endopeptidase MepM/ murein hydrolase activator NlpD
MPQEQDSNHGNKSRRPAAESVSLLPFERRRPLMVSIRATARALLVLALLGFAAGSAAAFTPPPEPKPRPQPPSPKPKPRNQIVFPVLGTSEFTNDFGAPRSQGAHQGVDILAPRRALALAAEPGRVRFHVGSYRAGCMLYLDGRSGTTWVYIHLNNDLTEGNDNRGGCKHGVAFPRGLKSGARVAAGQPVGYVGDSGDANGIHPHLHFEMHPGGGRATNPYQTLLSARRLLFYAPPGSAFTLTLSATVIAATADSLRVRVNTLRMSPTSLTLRRLNRPLTLNVPTYAAIERGAEGRLASLTSARPGERVAVWTEGATVTPAAQDGRPRAISAERIVLPTS